MGGRGGSGAAAASPADQPVKSSPSLNPFADELEPKPETMTRLDRIIAEAVKALEDGDEEYAGQLFDKAQAIERAEKAREERKARTEKAKYERMEQLIAQGMDGPEAQAQAFGTTIEDVYRQAFIKKARDEGHTGRGFDELIASAHTKYVAEQYWKAEAETNGYMVKRKYELTFNPAQLWNVNDAKARKVMSDEMASWFDRNGGRITRTAFRNAILSGTGVFDTISQRDFLQ